MKLFTLYSVTACALYLFFCSPLAAQPIVAVKNLEQKIVAETQINLKKEVATAKVVSEVKEKIVDKEKPKEYKKVPLLYSAEDSEYRFAFKFRPEFFYGKNLRLLEIPGNRIDEILYFRHTIDFIGEYHYGKASRGHDVTMVKFDVRNRGIWGDAESIILSSETPIRRVDVLGADHKHYIPRHLLWIRELWMQMTLNDIFDFPWCNQHTLTIGAFPFEVGRGIALGSAYGTGPDLLGFYAENAIDQYGFGAKLSGDWIKDTVGYDLYAEIVDNRASNFGHVTSKIRAQEYGHQFSPFREFGVINYILAARLRLTPCFKDFDSKAIYLEPYVVFNDQREQKLEFLGDATARLVTPGISGEFASGNIEWGFDMAFNFGRQKVKGFDRNIIIEQNRNGYEVIVNSKVNQIALDGAKDSALKTDANQKIISASRKHESETENGKVIGENNLGVLVNADDRFRDPYCVKFGGKMFVFDIGYYLCKPSFKINAAVGYASGDENPHKTIDNTDDDLNHEFNYDGFISLQEVYSGTRVKSAFLLAGSGKVPRILSFGVPQINNPFPSNVDRFTNLIFTGGSIQAKVGKKFVWNLNPNILSYWQANKARIFDIDDKGKNVSRHADRHLGIEYNLFAETELVQDLRFFFVGAFFNPGKHFKHLEDKALNKDQLKFIENLKKSKNASELLELEKVPRLKANNAFFMNFGLEYKF